LGIKDIYWLTEKGKEIVNTIINMGERENYLNST